VADPGTCVGLRCGWHGEQLGDQRVFSDELRQADKNATFDLRADGLITGRSLFDLNSIGAGGVKVAVTGGTGDFNRARGEIAATFPAPGATLFVIDLD
jgi:hypothetical protein